ncbi:lipoyl(octanoyl) transferase LipB [Flavobacteriales bacterium]|nr:lipoyl(octanoyl) transferase LipB [Flavobacteriales bacterium]MDB9931900.1 lipoyl(octanoyl) transferase LipB [Flavobacteriales bacterium]MDC1370920.1 lipoyl(octanoyl) transferase LipB [Flavobacteriales bacterium]
MNKNITFEDLGLIEYQEAWDYQTKIFEKTIAVKSVNRKKKDQGLEVETTKNHLIFCEHPHVYTLGKSGKESHLLMNSTQLEENNISYHKINRGGDITYHGPGQIVGYPIFDLDNFFTDIHKYLRFIEEAVILTLEEYGIKSGRIDGLTGVWLDIDDPIKSRKICALGVKCSRWVTMHGFAFNVNTDLSLFKNIVPCGIDDKAVTSMQNELGKEIDITEVKKKLLVNLSNLFDFDVVK